MRSHALHVCINTAGTLSFVASAHFVLAQSEEGTAKLQFTFILYILALK